MTTPRRTLATLRRRLAAAELVHLNQVVAEQANRIAELEAALACANHEADAMQARAELWEDNYFAAAHEARFAGLVPGITQAGELLLIPAQLTH